MNIHATIDSILKLDQNATPKPWKWRKIDARARVKQLEGNTEFSDMCPILVPYVCDSCAKDGRKCLSPNDIDAECIVEYRKKAPVLAKKMEKILNYLSWFDMSEEELNIHLKNNTFPTEKQIVSNIKDLLKELNKNEDEELEKK